MAMSSPELDAGAYSHIQKNMEASATVGETGKAMLVSATAVVG